MKRAVVAGWAGVSLLLGGGAVVWWQGEARWQGPLYCFTDPDQVWGEAARPASATPTCPESQNVRREVRQKEHRIEQYSFSSWEPDAILTVLTQAGYRVVSMRPDDGIQLEAVLVRDQDRLIYVAEHRGSGTLVHLAGAPPR